MVLTGFDAMNKEKQSAIAAGFKVFDAHGDIRLVRDGIAYLFDDWQEVGEFIARQNMLTARNAGKAAKGRIKKATGSTRKNPSPRSGDLSGAKRLAARFHGREPGDDEIYTTAKPTVPDAMANIGQVFAIEYLAERDGTVYRFRHVFRSKSRPQLAVSPDGDFVTMLGGAWQFSEDGFIDR